MFFLNNHQLTVSILDPVADRERLGPRFCTGGYIYQVEDAQYGPLFSGPEFPAAFPSVINGQGLPEVFQFTLYEHEDEIEAEKLIIGVGAVDKRDPNLPYQLFTNAQTKDFCIWQIAQNENSLRMETTQAYKKWALHLTRDVRLEDRTLTITTQLQNAGGTPLPFRWFAHPFFPINADGQCCRFLMPASLPDNPAFAIKARGALIMNSNYNWREGYFQLLENCRNEKFTALQQHPRLGQIHVKGDFPLAKVAIWANDRTFSFEPFYEDVVPAEHERRWSLAYHF